MSARGDLELLIFSPHKCREHRCIPPRPAVRCQGPNLGLQSWWASTLPTKPRAWLLLCHKKYIIYIDECLACKYVCVSHACLVPEEVERGHQSPQSWSYRCLGAASNLDPLEEELVTL